MTSYIILYCRGMLKFIYAVEIYIRCMNCAYKINDSTEVITIKF